MKKMSVIVALLASLLLLQGCDFFRMVAGRPSSREIAEKRAMIEMEQMVHRLRLDSLERVKKQMADSLAALDSLRSSGSKLVVANQLSEESRWHLSHAYYVIVGAFASRENAVRHAAYLETEGYQATLISYRNGTTAVGILPSDNITEAYNSLRNVRSGNLSPEAWILQNK